MRIVAVSASLSQESSTRLLTERLVQQVGADEVTHVELRLLAHDLVNALLTRVNPPALQAALDAVVAADGLVVASPVLNASYAGLFKMFFEVLEEGALLDTPVLLAATGGTPRHSLAIDQAMLPLFFYLKAAVVPTSVFAATEDWGDAHSGLSRRIAKAAQELAAMVALRSGVDLADVVDEEPGAVRNAPDKPVRDDVASVGSLHLTQDFAQMMGNLTR